MHRRPASLRHGSHRPAAPGQGHRCSRVRTIRASVGNWDGRVPWLDTTCSLSVRYNAWAKPGVLRNIYNAWAILNVLQHNGARTCCTHWFNKHNPVAMTHLFCTRQSKRIGLSAEAKNYVAYAIMQTYYCKYCSMHAIRRYIGLSAEAKNYVAYAIMQTYFCKYCSMHATHRYNLTYDPSFMLLY